MQRSKVLRLLIVAPSLIVPGGQAVQAARLLNSLSKEQDCTVSFASVNPRLQGVIGKLQKIKYVRTVITSLIYIITLLTRIRKCDVVHVFSASYWSFLLLVVPVILISRLYRKKVLLNYHSGEAEDHLSNWRSALPVIKMADAVVVPSKFLEDVFSRFGIKVDVIPNTIDTSQFVYRERKTLTPVLLSNRNFEPLYNIECTLRAFALIQNQFAEARFIVVGDGSEKNRLFELSQKLSLKQIEFTGRITPDEMPSHYDRADIYVNSSNIDNMPLSLIESFSSGVPVVSTNAGGIPYMLENGKTGLLVQCNDHKALAEQCIRLLNDNLLAFNIIRDARSEAEKYSWASVRKQWMSVYKKLAEIK